jgi:DNA modification methylase
MKKKLMLGDCVERMKEIPDNSIDCVITDLPYGKTRCKWDAVIPFEPMWNEVNRIIKDNGAIGLSVFYTLAFASIIIETLVIPQILNLGYIVFGVIFTLGFFKPFKEGNKEEEP